MYFPGSLNLLHSISQCNPMTHYAICHWILVSLPSTPLHSGSHYIVGLFQPHLEVLSGHIQVHVHNEWLLTRMKEIQFLETIGILQAHCNDKRIKSAYLFFPARKGSNLLAATTHQYLEPSICTTDTCVDVLEMLMLKWTQPVIARAWASPY